MGRLVIDKIDVPCGKMSLTLYTLEERPCEDTARRQLSTSQEEGPQPGTKQTSTLIWTSSLQNHKE